MKTYIVLPTIEILWGLSIQLKKMRMGIKTTKRTANMAYNQQLAASVRKSLSRLENIEEKQMMGGLTFMYNDKMCVGVFKDELMCRIDPNLHTSAITKTGCRTMDFTNRPMKGYVLVNDTGMGAASDLEYWIGLALDFNKNAKTSKKKK